MWRESPADSIFGVDGSSHQRHKLFDRIKYLFMLITGSYINGVAVSHQGQIYATHYTNNRLYIYTPDGTRTPPITITGPWDVCVLLSGRHLMVLHKENSQSGAQLVISVLSPDGHVRRRLCVVTETPVGIFYTSLSLLNDRYMAVCVNSDIHLYDISDQLIWTRT